LTVALSKSNNCTIRGGAENALIDATAYARGTLLFMREVRVEGFFAALKMIE
jgi:hypothetical protein